MKNTEYKKLNDYGGDNCPMVIEKGEEIVVIGTLLSPEEEAQMKKSVNVGVAPYERVVRIPRAIFEEAVDKMLTLKAESR